MIRKMDSRDLQERIDELEDVDNNEEECLTIAEQQELAELNKYKHVEIWTGYEGSEYWETLQVEE